MLQTTPFSISLFKMLNLWYCDDKQYVVFTVGDYFSHLLVSPGVHWEDWCDEPLCLVVDRSCWSGTMFLRSTVFQLFHCKNRKCFIDLFYFRMRGLLLAWKYLNFTIFSYFWTAKKLETDSWNLRHSCSSAPHCSRTKPARPPKSSGMNPNKPNPQLSKGQSQTSCPHRHRLDLFGLHQISLHNI